MLQKILILLGLFGTCFYVICALFISFLAKSAMMHCDSVDGWYVSGGSPLYSLYDLVILSAICTLLFTTAKILSGSFIVEVFCSAVLLTVLILSFMIFQFSDPYPIVPCTIDGMTDEINFVSGFLTYRFTYLVGSIVVLCMQMRLAQIAWKKKIGALPEEKKNGIIYEVTP